MIILNIMKNQLLSIVVKSISYLFFLSIYESINDNIDCFLCLFIFFYLLFIINIPTILRLYKVIRCNNNFYYFYKGNARFADFIDDDCYGKSIVLNNFLGIIFLFY